MDMVLDHLSRVWDREEHALCHGHGQVGRANRPSPSDLCYAVPAEKRAELPYISQYLCPLGI